MKSSLCYALIALLVVAACPAAVSGSDFETDRTIRLRALAYPSAMGFLDPFGAVAVNGRVVRGMHPLWGGEKLHVLSPGGAVVTIQTVGTVSLARGAIVSLSREPEDAFGEVERPALVASLVSGRMSVALEDGASAYFRAGGAVFSASPGARFRAVVDGSTSVAATAGSVQQLPQPPQRAFKLRPVGLGSAVSVKSRSTRQIQVRVTDETGQPVADVPIVFAVTNVDAGQLAAGAAAGASVTVTTDAQGVATVAFTAAEKKSDTDITATIQGTDTSIKIRVSVLATTAFLASGAGLLLVTGVVVAAAAASVAVATKEESDKSKTPTPSGPPIIVNP